MNTQIEQRKYNCKDLKFKAVDNENVRYTDEDRDKILNYLDGMDEKTGYEYGIELMFCLRCQKEQQAETFRQSCMLQGM